MTTTPTTHTYRTTSHGVHWCEGCDQKIPPETVHLEHELWRTAGAFSPELLDVLHECLTCAVRNGRPGFAEPDVPEQPLDLGGIA